MDEDGKQTRVWCRLRRLCDGFRLSLPGKDRSGNMGESSDWVVGLRVLTVASGAWLLAGCGNSTSDSRAHSAAGGVSGSGVAAAGAATERAGADGGGALGAGIAGASGASGSPGSAGSAGLSGGSGGLLLGESATEACIAYVVAQCLRRTECVGRPATVEGCMSGAATHCPDAMFSDGSARTVAGTQACAAQYATYPCEKLNAGVLPDCATPGTRTAGRACVFNAQCASLGCDLRTADCGVCSTLGELGAACSAPGTDCNPGLICDRGAGVCVTYVDQLAEGSPCVGASACQGALLCTQGVCAKFPTLGRSCEFTGVCAEDSYCSAGTRICTALPGAGRPCGMDDSGRGHCSGEAYCSYVDQAQAQPSCMPFPTAGQTCGPALNPDLTTSPIACAEGLFCDPSTVCVPPGAAGASCQGDGQCQTGLTCACNDTTCSARTCVRIGLRDEPCDVPGAVCHPGFSCVDGRCQARASQGLFAAMCPGQ